MQITHRVDIVLLQEALPNSPMAPPEPQAREEASSKGETKPGIVLSL